MAERHKNADRSDATAISAQGEDGAQNIDSAYLENLPKLRHYVHRLMAGGSNSHEVDDIMQEVYVRAYSAKKTEKLAFAKAYLFRVARNLTFKSNSKKAGNVEKLVEDFAAEGIIDNVVPQDEQLHQKRRMKVFFEAVSHLPPQCRQVFILRQMDGLTHQEISQKLGISTSTVEKHIAKGLRLSAQYMMDCGYDEQMCEKLRLPKRAAK